jgi:hypothetical protein
MLLEFMIGMHDAVIDGISSLLIWQLFWKYSNF